MNLSGDSVSASVLCGDITARFDARNSAVMYQLQRFICCLSLQLASDVHEVQVKVKFTLEQTMKAQRGSRGMALLFL